jgi:hypothetical protein
MQEVLGPSCNTSMGYAYPPRRFIEMAQDIGKTFPTYVDSICKTDWHEAFEGLYEVGFVENLSDDRACLPEAPPFDPSTCMTGCFLIERLNDDRLCEPDPTCPQAGCPPATPETLNVVDPCRNPSTGVPCVPVERDVGTEGSVGFERRLCLVRQAPRNPFVERCGEPLARGWYFVPPEWSLHECQELFFARAGGGPLIDSLSQARLRCWP